MTIEPPMNGAAYGRRLFSYSTARLAINGVDQKRRTFLFGLGTLGVSQVSSALVEAQMANRQGFAIGAAEGEHLVHFRDHGDIFINVGAATGSDSLAMGTQQVMVGTGIPTHRHLQWTKRSLCWMGAGP